MPAEATARDDRGRMARASHRARVHEIVRKLSEAAEAQAAERAATAAPGTASSGAPTGQLSAKYIKKAIKEITPLIKECYDNALSADPKLGGKLVVQFDIVGDPDEGGLVAESKIDPERSTMKSAAELRECVRETIYALELDPPEDGGKVTVRYPFKFSTAEKSEDRK